MRHLTAFLLFVWLHSPILTAQPVCPTGFPAESPVPSYSLDDIPPTNVDIITYTGALVKARANHNIAYVQITPNDQRVWFGPDASPGLYRTFYNRRVRDSATSPWRWLYSYSPAVIQYPQPTSAGPGSVLYSATPKYYDLTTMRNYKFIMYQVYQPGLCDGVIAGFLYVSYSDDGICWTTPRAAHRSGGPSFSCLPSETQIVPVEQVSAIDAGSYIWLVGVEGNIDELAPPMDETSNGEFTYRRLTNMEKTLTYLGLAYPSNPTNVFLNTPGPELSNGGLYLPQTGPYQPAVHPMRYAPYAYMMNLQTAYDATTGYFYIGRGYPYAYDRGSTVPLGWYDYPVGNNVPRTSQVNGYNLNGPHGSSWVEGCLDSPYTLPNRIQIYRMYIGPLSNAGQITTGTWSLVTDVGGPLGYAFNSWPGGPTTQTPLVYWQQNVGRDYGAVSFLRDAAGNLVRSGSTAYYFGADTYKLSKGGAAPCRITGNERVTVHTLP